MDKALPHRHEDLSAVLRIHLRPDAVALKCEERRHENVQKLTGQLAWHMKRQETCLMV